MVKSYDNEDVNTKFMRALYEEWDKKSTAIREKNDLDEITLEAVYGKLSTYDLEKQQRKTRKEGRTKSIALSLIQTDKEKYQEEQSGEILKQNLSKKKEKAIKVAESSNEESDGDSEIDIGKLMDIYWLWWMIIQDLLGCTSWAKNYKIPQLIMEFINTIERNSEFTVNVLRSDIGT